jgi:zinc protease
MAVPQSVARFGLPAMPRKDKDFLPAFVLNQILGGGVMSSRLWEEVREKRGLAYSVYTSVQPFKHTSIFAGGVATKNEEIGNTLDVINVEMKRIAAEGPTETELANAKSYLIGSFALRFDTNAKIANQLLWVLQEDLGKDYVDRRNDEIEAVTLDQVKAVAKRMFEGKELITTVVGKPKGLAPRG